MDKDFQSILDSLNKEQRLAVDTIDGPVLVLAGPGTGKTQVLTARIANILKNTDTPPDAILALTYTDSGVKAMRERLISIVGNAAYYVNIYTFHSFASDIIKSNPDEFIISTQLEPLSDLERIFIYREIIDTLDLKFLKSFAAKYYYLKSIMGKVTTLKREGVSPTEFIEYIEKSKLEFRDNEYGKNIDLQKIYEMYEKKLKEHGRYDFEDMINFVIQKFNDSPTLLAKYQERFHYFLVDEFQDTNSSQAELLYKLTAYWAENANIFVVGDDDQSIYRFQGASTENILDFVDRYPNALKVELKVNYRSDQGILNASRHLINHNKFRLIDKELSHHLTANNPSKALTHGSFTSSFTENHFIATKINELIKSGMDSKDIAIIYRNNKDATDIADMLARHKIPYVMESGENILEHGIIIKLLHLLSSVFKIKDKTEDLDLFTLLHYEFIKVSDLDVLKLARFASTKEINFLEAFERSDFKTAGFQDPEALLSVYNNLLKWNHVAYNVPFIEFLEMIIDESGYLNWILSCKNSFELLNVLNSLLTEVRNLNESDTNLSLELFLEYISLMRDHNIKMTEQSIDLSPNAVRLMTAHKSKGLEFEYVFIPKFIDKRWSNVKDKDLIKLPKSILKTTAILSKEDEKLRTEEDDRRLFYVALTRAKREIFITNANKYSGSGSDKSAVISMFWGEMSVEHYNELDVSKYEENASEVLSTLLGPIDRLVYITQDEREFLYAVLKNFKISPSSLNDYLTCGYKFKLHTLFRTPQPQPIYFVLGTAIHKAFETANENLIKGIPVMYDLLEKSFIKYIDAQLISKENYKNIRDEGLDILKVYYSNYKDEFETPHKNKILFLEKFIGGDWNKVLLNGSIPLVGKIDKAVLLDDDSLNKGHKSIRIIDYKTGKPKTKNEVLGLTKSSNKDQYRQLLFYKLLIDLDKSMNYIVSEVELDFTGNSKNKPRRELFVVENENMDELKELINKVAQDIHDLKFDKTSDISNCSDCMFKDHCWPDGIEVTYSEQLNLV